METRKTAKIKGVRSKEIRSRIRRGTEELILKSRSCENVLFY